MYIDDKEKVIALIAFYFNATTTKNVSIRIRQGDLAWEEELLAPVRNFRRERGIRDIHNPKVISGADVCERSRNGNICSISRGDIEVPQFPR